MRRGTLVPTFVPATECLRPFVEAGVLGPVDVHVAATVARLVEGSTPDVLIAAAVAVRATRLGHVCLLLDDPVASLIDSLDDSLDVTQTDSLTDSLTEPLTDSLTEDQQRSGGSSGVSGASGVSGLSALAALPWPEPDAWCAALAESDAVAVAGEPPGVPRPLVLDGRRLYLERYWVFERKVAADIVARAAPATPTTLDMVQTTAVSSPPEALRELIDAMFAGDDQAATAQQRRAVEAALERRFVVIGGGPGAGKTTTIAKLLAVLHAAWPTGPDVPPPEIALAAPTGKAAARMTAALGDAARSITGLDDDLRDRLASLQAVTIHRLLGSTGGLRFGHTADTPLTADIVIIDEASMISLPLMARLLDAIAPQARVVLLGDPNQLTSIEAGAVLGDLVAGATVAGATVAGATVAGATEAGGASPLSASVVLLDHIFRLDAEAEAISRLARAINSGDVTATLELLAAGETSVQWIRPDHTADADALASLRNQLAGNADAVVGAALAGNVGEGLRRLSDIKVLAAMRRGAFGVDAWREEIEQGLRQRHRRLGVGQRWYVGRPVLVTANDRIHRLSNGDTGLVVADTADTRIASSSSSSSSPASPASPFAGSVVAIGASDADARRFLPSQLADNETWWSMTIHKSQGSEFAHTVVSLPLDPSPIVTRELLYTAVTRARSKVTVVASEAVVRAAVERRVTRASGLADRLRSGDSIAT